MEIINKINDEEIEIVRESKTRHFKSQLLKTKADQEAILERVNSLLAEFDK